MPTLKEYQRNVELAIVELESTRLPDAIVIANDARALVVDRIVNTGTDPTGKKFSSYSEAVVPVPWLGSGLKSPGFDVKSKQKELIKKKGYFASYKDWREITGRRVDIKNFSFTGKMLENLEIKVETVGEGIVILRIGSKDKEFDEVIIPAHSNREGVYILGLNESETEFVQEAHEERILRILRNNNILE